MIGCDRPREIWDSGSGWRLRWPTQKTASRGLSLSLSLDTGNWGRRGRAKPCQNLEVEFFKGNEAAGTATKGECGGKCADTRKILDLGAAGAFRTRPLSR